MEPDRGDSIGAVIVLWLIATVVWTAIIYLIVRGAQ